MQINSLSLVLLYAKPVNLSRPSARANPPIAFLQKTIVLITSVLDIYTFTVWTSQTMCFTYENIIICASIKNRCVNHVQKSMNFFGDVL
jgi:hypothetical protein